MASRGVKFGSRGFRAVARKLLATADSQAPSPGPALYVCRDVKTGEVVHCQNPQTLLIIVAGMSCMMLLVTIAMLLLCWSVVRQRRLDSRRPESAPDHQLTGTAPPQTSTNLAVTTPTVAAYSPEYDDAVFVQLPGDEKPQFFALPTPFLTDTSKDTPKPADDDEAGAKDTVSSNNNTAAADPCLQSSDGLYRNPLFASH